MPKKLGTNPKAAEARERKATQKKSANEKATRDAEDRLWEDNDRNLAKKQSRKEEEERKRAEQMRRKAEAKQLLDQEMSSIKVAPKQSIQKITQAEIKAETERRNKAIEAANKANEKPVRWIVVIKIFVCEFLVLTFFFFLSHIAEYSKRRGTTIGREFESRSG